MISRFIIMREFHIEKEKSIGAAKLEIMQAVWARRGPCTSFYPLGQVKGWLSWRLSTLMTSLPTDGISTL